MQVSLPLVKTMNNSNFHFSYDHIVMPPELIITKVTDDNSELPNKLIQSKVGE